MLAGEQVQASAAEEVKEEVKGPEVKSERTGLFDVAKVNWDYFSPENLQKTSI